MYVIRVSANWCVEGLCVVLFVLRVSRRSVHLCMDAGGDDAIIGIILGEFCLHVLL